MKKSLSLVLAAAMLSTTAMAATLRLAPEQFKNGSKIGVRMEDFTQSVTKKKGDNEYKGVLSLGSSNLDQLEEAALKLDVTEDKDLKKLAEEFNYNINAFDFTADNFSVRYKFSRGQELLDKFEFDGKGMLVMSFKDVTNPKEDRPNVVLNELKVRSRRTLYDFDGETKTMRSGQEFTFNIGEKFFYRADDEGKLTVPFSSDTNRDNYIVVGTKDVKVPVGEYDLEPSGDFFKIEKSKSDPDMYRADVEYSGEIIESLQGRIYVGDRVKFNLPGELDDSTKKVIIANEDATIEPLTVVMEGFSTNFSIRLNPEYINDVESKDLKIYTVDNGKLAPANLKWNDADYVWEGKINKSTTYLISDIALKGVAAGGNSTSGNPSTGLNVNVASAIVK